MLILSPVVREQVRRFKGLYTRRDELVSKIPDFWLRVVNIFIEKAELCSLNTFSKLMAQLKLQISKISMFSPLIGLANCKSYWHI